MIQIVRLLLFLLLFGSGQLLSQQLRFKHLTSEEGLSTNYVKAIVQDNKGFMWFGTQDGLNRYDGVQIRVFKNDPTSKTSLSNSDVTSILQVNESQIYVGTAGGLNILDLYTNHFKQPVKGNELLNAKVNSMTKLNEQLVLVASNAGLYEWNVTRGERTSRHFGMLDSLDVKCLLQFKDEWYAATAEHGLWKLTARGADSVGYKFAEYLKKTKDLAAPITWMDQYGGKMYLGTYGKGILVMDADHEIEKVISFSGHDDNSNYIRHFVIRKNKLYAATAQGFVLYNLISEESSAFVRNEQPFSLNSNPCNFTYIDKESNLWVGTDLGGVNISFIRSQKFPNSPQNFEMKFSNVYAMLETSPDDVLIGGVQLLSELNFQNGKVTPRNKFLENGTVLSIIKESENVYWYGTWGNGLYRYEADKNKATNVIDNKTGGTVLCLLRHDEYIYAGTLGDGLFQINTRTQEVIHYTDNDGLPNMSINTIFMDSKGRVWIGTYDGGLVMMKGFPRNGKLPIEKLFVNKGRRSDIASNTIYGINEDKKGNIWAATTTGLSKLVTDTFRNYYEKDGLANTYLYSILKDSLDNFWISSNSGIIRFNPLVNDKDIIFKNYGIKDGLVNTEYNMGAAYVSPSGMMYFGGARGFNRFRPTAIKDNLHAPEVYIVSYKRGGNDVETDSLIQFKKNLKLSWRENYFQFELVALDYTDPTKNKFKYMLEGYDKDWSAPTGVRFVSYTELPGGEYTFKVKAANNDGIWNEKPLEIHITVVPPFWKTKTFYVLTFVFTIAAIIAFTQYRTRAIKRENRILESKVAERTKELEEKNNDIMSSIQYAKRIQEAILPSRDDIFTKIRKIFILYKPKDIVSGDFYWFAEKNDWKVFAVVDCTGHGVPGAFMSMIGHNLLHQIVLDKGHTNPASILNELHKGVQKALRQGHNEINTNDGMDVSLIAINDKLREVRWAGANRPLVIIDQNGQFARIEGNKFPVGGAQVDVDRKFTSHKVDVNAPAMAYMFSDGYADQFGGEKGKKFMVKRFHELLSSIYRLPAEEQRSELEKNFELWRNEHEQVDDVLIVGLEI